MGMKIKNSYYSNKEIWSVLQRKGYVKVGGDHENLCSMGDKIQDAYYVFESIVKKRLNQTKQEFLDSL